MAPARASGDLDAAWSRRPLGALVLRCTVEGLVLGGVLGSLVAAALLVSAVGRDMQRMGESPGPGLVLTALAQGPLLGLLPGALAGAVLANGYLIFVALVLRLCADPGWAWTVIGATTVAPVLLITASVGGATTPWALLGLLWVSALTLFVRAKQLSRGRRHGRVVDPGPDPRTW